MIRSMKYSLLSPNLSAIFFAVLIALSIFFFTSKGFSQDSTIHIQGGTLAPQNPLLKFTSDFMKLNEKYAVVGIQNGYTIYLSVGKFSSDISFVDIFVTIKSFFSWIVFSPTGGA